MICLSCKKYGNNTEGPGGGEFAVGCKLFFQFIEFILVGPLIFWLGP